MKRSSILLIAVVIGVILVPQCYYMATSDEPEAVAGRLAFLAIPLLFGSLWLIGLVGRTIERIIKGRG